MVEMAAAASRRYIDRPAGRVGFVPAAGEDAAPAWSSVEEPMDAEFGGFPESAEGAGSVETGMR